MDTETVWEHSHYVESALQHAFLAALLSQIWREFPGEELQVYNAEVDSSGFDVVLTFRGKIRHVQLKSTSTGSTTKEFPINEKLWEVLGGCVLLIGYQVETLQVTGYRFWGHIDGKMPDVANLKQAKATRANSQGIKPLRRNTRILPKSHFHPQSDIKTIVTYLFGH